MKDKQQTYLRYIRHLSEVKDSYTYIGRAAVVVGKFLDGVSNIGKREYRRFCKEQSEWLVRHSQARQHILDFLSYCGVGFERKKRTKEISENRKLCRIDVKCNDDINNFIVWLQNEKDLSVNTLRIYSTSMKEYFKYFSDFNQNDARLYCDGLYKRGFSPSTIRLRIGSFERFGEYKGIPCKIKRPKITRTLNVDNIPTDNEYEMLCEWAKERIYASKRGLERYVMIRLLGTTGCRKSELMQFTWEMLAAGSVELKGKGNKFRQFFFIDELRKLAKGKTGLIFPMTDRVIDLYLKDMAKKTGIDKRKMHAHAFRHFFAKRFLQKTKDIAQLADFLGHESIDTTRIYLRKSKNEQQRIINRTVSW